MTDFTEAVPEIKEYHITLISNDGEEFQVSSKIATLSKFIKNILEESDSTEDQQIRLPNVNKLTLVKVLEFANHYFEEPMTELTKPLADPDISKLVQPFYANYILSTNNDVYLLLIAANYLDMKPLLDLCCARVASFIKNKSPEEVRANLKITSVFTPEDQAAVRAENPWAESL